MLLEFLIDYVGIGLTLNIYMLSILPFHFQRGTPTLFSVSLFSTPPLRATVTLSLTSGQILFYFYYCSFCTALVELIS